MSRSDWITAFATALIAGIAWFVSGPKFAIASIVVGLVGLILVHVFRKKEKLSEKSTATSDLSLKDSFNPHFVQTGATINVNVGQSSPTTASPHEQSSPTSGKRNLSLAESILEQSLPGRLERPTRVELTPSEGQSNRMLLAVKNLGPKQRFRAQCRIMDRRNDSNPPRRMTVNLRWEVEGIVDMTILSYESRNLVIAAAERQALMEWMKILGVSEQPESIWTHGQKNNLPE